MPANTFTICLPDLLSLFGDHNLLIGSASPFVFRPELSDEFRRVYSCPLGELISNRSAKNIDNKVCNLLLADHNEDELKTDRISMFTANTEARIEIDGFQIGESGYICSNFAIRCTDDTGVWFSPDCNSYNRDYDSVVSGKRQRAEFRSISAITAVENLKDYLARMLSPENIQAKLRTALNSYSEEYVYRTIERKEFVSRVFPRMFKGQLPKILNEGNSFSFGYLGPNGFYHLKWFVLEKNNGKAFCTTDYTYYSAYTYCTGRNQSVPLSWKDSSLRKYLNGKFASSAGLLARAEDSCRILPTELQTKITMRDGKVKYETTTDRLFVPSPEKAKENSLQIASRFVTYSWEKYWLRELIQTDASCDNDAAFAETITYRSARNCHDVSTNFVPLTASDTVRPYMVLSTD